MARKYATRVDGNQADIVRAFQSVGATVQHLHNVGLGCPDLLIGFRGVNYLAEIKDPKASKKDQKLRQGQTDWHDAWRGQVAVVKTRDQALNLLGLVEVRGVIS